MASVSAPDEVFRRVVASLEHAGTPYMLTGSLASSVHGAPRTTQDLDFVIAVAPEELDRLLSEFPADKFYVSRDAALQALRRSAMFNVVDLESGWKIDFILRKDREFSVTEFNRRLRGDIMGLAVYMTTPEDSLLSKLEWAKRSESERQIDDAAGIYRAKRDRLDMSYLDHWVEELGLEVQWSQAKSRAES